MHHETAGAALQTYLQARPRLLLAMLDLLEKYHAARDSLCKDD